MSAKKFENEIIEQSNEYCKALLEGKESSLAFDKTKTRFSAEYDFVEKYKDVCAKEFAEEFDAKVDEAVEQDSRLTLNDLEKEYQNLSSAIKRHVKKHDALTDRLSFFSAQDFDADISKAISSNASIEKLEGLISRYKSLDKSIKRYVTKYGELESLLNTKIKKKEEEEERERKRREKEQRERDAARNRPTTNTYVNTYPSKNKKKIAIIASAILVPIVFLAIFLPIYFSNKDNPSGTWAIAEIKNEHYVGEILQFTLTGKDDLTVDKYVISSSSAEADGGTRYTLQFLRVGKTKIKHGKTEKEINIVARKIDSVAVENITVVPFVEKSISIATVPRYSASTISFHIEAVGNNIIGAVFEGNTIRAAKTGQIQARVVCEGIISNTFTITSIADIEGATKISTLQQLQNISSNLSGTYQLVNDIVLPTTNDNWTPIGTQSSPFIGKFYGNGFSIKKINLENLLITGTGVFGAIGSNGLVSGLNVENIDIKGQNCGGITGFNSGIIENCAVSGTMNKSICVSVGGIAGVNSGTIRNSKTEIIINGQENIGGIAGSSTGTITNCISSSTIQATISGGGIAGSGSGSISNSDNRGSITCTTATGGIIGSGTGNITSCVNYADVSGNTNVGGIIGSQTGGQVTSNENFGDITATGDNAGGIAGFARNVSVSACRNRGIISAQRYAGGIIGRSDTGVTFGMMLIDSGSVVNTGDDGSTLGVSSSINTISSLQGSTSFTISVTGGTGNYTYVFSKSSELAINIPMDTNDGEPRTFSISRSSNVDSSGTLIVTVTDRGSSATGQVVIQVSTAVDSSSTCVTEGTLITMADGSQKKVEELRYLDNVLTWDFVNGVYAIAPILLVEEHDSQYMTVITLRFSDGTAVSITFEHSFFNLTLNRFVSIGADNAESFIGHEFKKSINEDGNFSYCSVQLLNIEFEQKLVRSYNITTAWYFNHYAEGLLAGPGGRSGKFLLNIFEINDDLMFDSELMEKDIELYGLYAYEEFSDYLSSDLFMLFNGQNLKVAVGKGITTIEEILEMLEVLLNNAEGVY